MNLYLDNPDLTALRLRVDKVSTDAQVNYYSLFRSVQDLVQSQNYVGPYADAFRNYLQTVTMQAIAEILELTEEVARISRKIESDFQGLESSSTGIIRQVRLEDVRTRLLSRQNEFEDYIEQVSKINERIKNLGVTTGALGRNAVVGSYRDARSMLLNVNVDLNNIDRQNLAELRRIEGRIDRLCSILSNVSNVVVQGNVDFSSLEGLSIVTGTPHVLMQMLAQDPTSGFGNLTAASAGRWTRWNDDGSLDEGKWKFGTTNSGQYNGVNWWQGDIFSWDRTRRSDCIDGTQTNLRFNAGQLFMASGDGHASVNFTGVGLTENISGRESIFGVNANSSAQANLLSGDAHFNWQPQDRNNFNFGGSANASIAGAGVSTGFGSHAGGSGTGGISLSGEIGAVGGLGGINISSQEVRNTGDAQVNYISVSFSPPGFGKKVGINISGEVSIPNVIWNW